MGQSRHAKDRIIPELRLDCRCGKTLGYVTLPRRPNGDPKDPTWEIGGLQIMVGPNSREGYKYEHNHADREHTYTFKCEYIGGKPIGVLSVERERERERKLEESGAALRALRSRRPDSAPDPNPAPAPTPQHRIAGEPVRQNPARYTAAGVTPAKRTLKKEQGHCGCTFAIRGEWILAEWHRLAGTTPDTPPFDALIAERDAYQAARQKWRLDLREFCLVWSPPRSLPASSPRLRP